MKRGDAWACAIVVGALTACAPEPHRATWTISIGAAHRATARTVEARVTRGACVGEATFEAGGALFRATLPAGAGVQATTRPPALDPGMYCFAARIATDGCLWTAYGTTDVSVVASGAMAVRTEVGEVFAMPRRCTAGECLGAACGESDAAVAADARVDAAPLVDAASDAGSPVDAGSDAFTAPIDAGTDAFLPPVDAGADGAGPTCGDSVLAVAAGHRHTCAITAAHELLCWGANDTAQLGLGVSPPGPDERLPRHTDCDVADVAPGSQHTCAVTSANRLRCWGNQYHGAVGNGLDSAGTFQLAPVTVGTWTTWTSIAAGQQHSCGVRGDTLYCWGYNAYHKLGLGDASDRSTPIDTLSRNRADVIALSMHHGCVAGDANGLQCWGRNDRGQAGGASYTDVTTPTALTFFGGTIVISVGAGDMHSCAVTEDGELYCWGSNYSGQLGVTGVATTATPQRVGTATNWVSVSAGAQHTCGIRGAGELYCWGDNFFGQLGVGVAASTAIPQRIGAAMTWAGVSAGGSRSAGFSDSSHTCAVTTSGALYCWGSNDDGQLGDGTVIARSTLVEVCVDGDGCL